MLERKPLKRDENLVILSQEHHHGLVFANRLQKGVEKNADPNVMADYVMGFWKDHLAQHFKSEEEHLLPCLGRREPLVQKLVMQHAEIRKLIEEIETEEEPLTFAMGKLAKLLHDHIRFEERQFFPFIEKKIEPKQLQKVGDLLHDHEVACYNFRPHFWK